MQSCDFNNGHIHDCIISDELIVDASDFYNIGYQNKID